MARYIDADALIDFLDVGHLRHPSELCFSEVDVANLLLHAPTISPDEVRGVGEWVDKRTIEHDGEWWCTACGEEITIYMGKDRKDRYAFCPNCGARLRNGGTDDS